MEMRIQEHKYYTIIFNEMEEATIKQRAQELATKWSVSTASSFYEDAAAELFDISYYIDKALRQEPEDEEVEWDIMNWEED